MKTTTILPISLVVIISLFCLIPLLANAGPNNQAEAMAELERIKNGEAPQGGMSGQDFMGMTNSGYSENDNYILCENNMIKIRAAKESFLNNNIDRIDTITVITQNDINPYMRGSFASLKCNSGGNYSIGEVDTPPACSVHGPLT